MVRRKFRGLFPESVPISNHAKWIPGRYAAIFLAKTRKPEAHAKEHYFLRSRFRLVNCRQKTLLHTPARCFLHCVPRDAMMPVCGHLRGFVFGS
jgi:hypothetical protein